MTLAQFPILEYDYIYCAPKITEITNAPPSYSNAQYLHMQPQFQIPYKHSADHYYKFLITFLNSNACNILRF